MFAWESGRPEDYGIPGDAVKRLEDLIERRRIRLHGYMLTGGRRILSEKYYEPYGQGDLHRMYSITKSFVAMGVGLLLKKGLIGLDDRICDYFPEKLPAQGAHPWCADLTIREMLAMRTCHANTTYKNSDCDDWTESFFRVRPTHVSGTVFSYDTSSAHVLGALVEKLTGRKLLDFLREEAFHKVGFSGEAYILEDPSGVSQGGSGMMCTLRDVAGVAYLCNRFGVLEGEELLPRDFMREAVCDLTPTDLQPTLDEQCGYGYFFWMPRTRKGQRGPGEGFVMYGMGGQLAVCFPRLDFCYLTMADTIGNPAGLQILYDCFYETVYPYLRERREDNPAAFEDGTGLSAGGADPGAAGPDCHRGREDYRFYDNAQGWQELSLNFEKAAGDKVSEGILSVNLRYVRKGGETVELALSFALGAWRRADNLLAGYRCECRADWKQGHLILQCYLTDQEHGHFCMDIAWKGENLCSVRMNCTNEICLTGLRGFASARMKDEEGSINHE